FGFDGEQELVDAHAVDHVFHARLQAVGAVARLDENAHDGVRDFGRVFRPDDDAGVLGKIPVAGNATNRQLEPDAGLNGETFLDLDRSERDVIGVFKHRDLASTIERDVELARQPGQRAIVENVIVPFASVRAGVDQFLRIDAGSGRARDIANVVSSGATRTQSDVLDALDQPHGVFRCDLLDLEIGAGGDMRIAAGTAFREIGNRGELPVLQNAVRNAQAAH